MATVGVMRCKISCGEARRDLYFSVSPPTPEKQNTGEEDADL